MCQIKTSKSQMRHLGLIVTQNLPSEIPCWRAQYVYPPTRETFTLFDDAERFYNYYMKPIVSHVDSSEEVLKMCFSMSSNYVTTICSKRYKLETVQAYCGLICAILS